MSDKTTVGKDFYRLSDKAETPILESEKAAIWSDEIADVYRFRVFVQWVADHSSDPAIVAEAKRHGAK